jgi:predicted nucleotidyltransferase
MSPSARPTPRAEVNRLLEGLLSGMRAVLRDRLVGLYLYGSLTTGDFDPQISDIDLLAAVAGDVNAGEFEALRQMHIEFARDNREWDDRIDVAYLSLRALRTFRDERSAMALITPGEPFHVAEAGREWLTNWYAVRETGVALFGPPAQTLIDPISREESAECVRGYVAEWGERIRGVRARKEQAYAILSMCRALYLHKVGEQASKRQAALWARRELPQWSGLIGSALAWREAWRDEDVDHEATLAEAVRFVDFVRERILGSRGR